MSSGTGRGLRPGGVVRALGRLSLMIVFGFGAGLLIGVLSEEPQLLAGHLRGESVAVELTPSEGVLATNEHGGATAAVRRRSKQALRVDTASERRLPQVAASAALRATEAPKAAPRPRATPVARNDRSRPWAIQVGAFSEEASAQKLSRALDAKGYSTQILSAGSPAGRWRVRIQPIAGEAKARRLAAELKRAERLPTWVLPLEASSPR